MWEWKSKKTTNTMFLVWLQRGADNDSERLCLHPHRRTPTAVDLATCCSIFYLDCTLKDASGFANVVKYRQAAKQAAFGPLWCHLGSRPLISARFKPGPLFSPNKASEDPVGGCKQRAKSACLQLASLAHSGLWCTKETTKKQNADARFLLHLQLINCRFVRSAYFFICFISSTATQWHIVKPRFAHVRVEHKTLKKHGNNINANQWQTKEKKKLVQPQHQLVNT